MFSFKIKRVISVFCKWRGTFELWIHIDKRMLPYKARRNGYTLLITRKGCIGHMARQ
jgi:hypothetical protein